MSEQDPGLDDVFTTQFERAMRGCAQSMEANFGTAPTKLVNTKVLEDAVRDESRQFVFTATCSAAEGEASGDLLTTYVLEEQWNAPVTGQDIHELHPILPITPRRVREIRHVHAKARQGGLRMIIDWRYELAAGTETTYFQHSMHFEDDEGGVYFVTDLSDNQVVQHEHISGYTEEADEALWDTAAYLDAARVQEALIVLGWDGQAQLMQLDAV